MFEAVQAAIAAGELDVEIAVVFCNRERGEGEATDAFLDRVEALGIPLVARSSVAYRRAVNGERSSPDAPLPAWREAYDREAAEALEPHPFDLGVLAGYMLIFGAEFVTRHPLLNLHPALPDGPVGTWQAVNREVIRTGATEHGVMFHLAVPEVDAGPRVAYCRFPLRDPELEALREALPEPPERLDDEALEATPLWDAVRARGMAREAPLLLATLAEFASGRRRVEGGRILDANEHPAPPADLTAHVDAQLAARLRH
jgi:phosphoribosylglycinamide formyltransferase-1